MIYNLSNNYEKQNAITRFKNLLENGKKVELKVKHPRKSISHNAYAHLIMSWFAVEYGESLEYVKQEIFKKVVNTEIFKTEFVNKKTGEIRTAWRSFAKLDSKETSIAIDRFRDYSSREAGIYLPEPNDLASINNLETELSKFKHLI